MSGPSLNSNVQRLCQVAGKLPAHLRALYEAHFLQMKDKDVCCAELSLTPEQFDMNHREVVRNIRAGIGASLAAVPEAA